MAQDWLKQAVDKGLISEGKGVNLAAFLGDSKPIVKMKITEAQFQASVILLAQALGWKVAHFRKVRVQRKNGQVYYETPVAADGAGWPDLVLVRDRVIFAELKSASGSLEPEQEVWIEALKAAGQEVHIWKPADLPEITSTLSTGRKMA